MKIETFSVIGFGKVGQLFTKIFKRQGLFLDFIVDKRSLHFEGIDSLQEIPENIESDLILIATPDNLIENTINYILKYSKIRKETIFLHFSGALYIKNEKVVSIHPMMSITSSDYEMEVIKNHYFTFQADNEELIGILLDVLKGVIQNYGIIKGNEKKYFHLASVIINNFSTALIYSAVNVLKKTGRDEKEVLKFLLPLFNDVYDNINKNKSLLNSLTGPVVRGDKKTVDIHINTLKELNLSEEKDIYELFVDYIVKKILQ